MVKQRAKEKGEKMDVTWQSLQLLSSPRALRICPEAWHFNSNPLSGIVPDALASFVDNINGYLSSPGWLSVAVISTFVQTERVEEELARKHPQLMSLLTLISIACRVVFKGVSTGLGQRN